MIKRSSKKLDKTSDGNYHPGQILKSLCSKLISCHNHVYHALITHKPCHNLSQHAKLASNIIEKHPSFMDLPLIWLERSKQARKYLWMALDLVFLLFLPCFSLFSPSLFVLFFPSSLGRDKALIRLTLVLSFILIMLSRIVMIITNSWLRLNQVLNYYWSTY